MNDLGPFACHCVATRQMARHISRIYERHMAPSGITTTQFAILSFLDGKPMSANELADILLMDRTTLLRALKPLREKGLILSTHDTTERRRHLFSLPPTGGAKIEEAKPLWQAAQDEYEQLVGAENAFRLRGEFLSLTGAKV